ncbi:MAG: hypothetical protein EA376_10275 [Phycisphaeraceae bacterium]|nr:MAG: hypothetical protein EA376_10275 [Phycisphaeraceae bacterium]
MSTVSGATSTNTTPAADVSEALATAVRRGLSPQDLAELFNEFNELTSRLQETHETLSARVAQLESELRDANRQLRRSRELAALGEMAAGIAHEVRNPLGSIGLYAGMLEEDLADRPEQQGVAVKIGRAVQGLDRIVGDVLTFAREIRLRAEPVEARSLLEHAVESCRGPIEGAAVAVRVNEVDGPGIDVVCDPAMVNQALVNLVRNACDALAEAKPAGGATIELQATRRATRDATGVRRAMIALLVRDNGPGVPEEVKERMFNPFFTTRQAGTGLGLAIVHRIADAHGGGVTVRNRPGAGAEVELLLPAEPETTRTTREAETQGGVR